MVAASMEVAGEEPSFESLIAFLVHGDVFPTFLHFDALCTHVPFPISRRLPRRKYLSFSVEKHMVSRKIAV
jgi:hypothetical protein